MHVDDDSGSSVDMEEVMLLYMYVQVKKGKVTQKNLKKKRITGEQKNVTHHFDKSELNVAASRKE